MAVGEWEWDPETYLAEMADEIPGYEELQEAVAAAAADLPVTRVLSSAPARRDGAAGARAQHPAAE